MANFTEDQWIGLNGGTCNKELVITTVNRRLNGVGAICEMNVTFDSDFQIEQRANADLIVAAPAMYEALTKLTEMYTDMINSGDCGNWNPEEDEEVILARKVLSKARGEP